MISTGFLCHLFLLRFLALFIEISFGWKQGLTVIKYNDLKEQINGYYEEIADNESRAEIISNEINKLKNWIKTS